MPRTRTLIRNPPPCIRVSPLIFFLLVTSHCARARLPAGSLYANTPVHIPRQLKWRASVYRRDAYKVMPRRLSAPCGYNILWCIRRLNMNCDFFANYTHARARAERIRYRMRAHSSRLRERVIKEISRLLRKPDGFRIACMCARNNDDSSAREREEKKLTRAL